MLYTANRLRLLLLVVIQFGLGATLARGAILGVECESTQQGGTVSKLTLNKLHDDQGYRMVLTDIYSDENIGSSSSGGGISHDEGSTPPLPSTKVIAVVSKYLQCSFSEKYKGAFTCKLEQKTPPNLWYLEDVVTAALEQSFSYANIRQSKSALREALILKVRINEIEPGKSYDLKLGQERTFDYSQCQITF